MNQKIPLKIFWEIVEQRLSACSADDLRAILRAMAQRVPPSGRRDFIAQLGAGEVSLPVPRTPWEDLLADIEDLELEIQDTMASADDWEDEYGWQYEEDSLGPYVEFVEPATLLFERAALAFDNDEIALARQAYRQLFDLLDQEDDYGRGLSLHDLNLDRQEAVARYLRAVCESEPPGNRPQALFDEMSRFFSISYPPRRVMLLDLIQISPRPLPDREAFLSDWIAFLQAQTGPQADAWLREAVRMAQGTAGLERLARTKGREHPRAYLDWFAALEEEGRQAEVLTAAREALQTLPPDLPIRAAIADHLCAAAAHLDDPASLREGRWEAFVAKPTLSRLLDLWEAFPPGDERTTWMQRASEHIQQVRPRAFTPVLYSALDDLERPARPGAALLAHARLLACDLEAAHQAVAKKRVLGWSSASSDQALLLSFLLILLSGESPETLPHNLDDLWAWSLLVTSLGQWGYGKENEEEKRLPKRTAQVYAEHIVWGRESGRLTLDEEQDKAYLNWCLDVARQRVEAIVGNQHRKSYAKAAMLTVACAEVLRLRGDETAARTWVSEIRERFPRHRAFQSKLRNALERKWSR